MFIIAFTGLGHISSVHTLMSYFFKTHFNIIIPSTPSLPNGLFPSRFPTAILYVFFMHPVRAICPENHILLGTVTLVILAGG